MTGAKPAAGAPPSRGTGGARRRAARWLLAAPALLTACSDDPGSAGTASALEPTFSGGVAEVLYENCAVCHRPGGAAPFALLTYEQARARGDRIVEATESGYMPPWRPSRPVGAFADERTLPDDAKALIREWVAEGMPEGDPGEAPQPPAWTDEWQLGVPDLVLEMEGDFVVPAGEGELFRNFVLPVALDSARWIASVEFKPGSSRVVHHATMALDRTNVSRELDAADPAPGFDGMGSAGGAEHPAGFFIGWTPGKSPAPGPEGVSWRLEPGTDVVARLHLRPVDEDVVVSPRVGLYFADRAPARIPVTVQLGAQSMIIPPGESAYEVADSFTLPVPVDVTALYPHAHYLGDVIQAWAETPAGERVWLLEIPDWDFNWQDEYRFEDAVPLPAGSTIHIRYTYDNSADNPLNPNDPPVRVTYGARSVDEMADLLVQVVPRSPEASVRLQQAVDAKVAEVKLGGYRLALETEGESATVRYNMGIAESARGRRPEAEAHLRAAVRLDPGFAEAHNNLGIILQQQGRLPEAVEAYQRSLGADPEYARAHYNLGVALQELGRPVEAGGHFLRAVEADPEFPLPYSGLAEVALARGDFGEAIDRYRRRIELDPANPGVRLALGMTQVRAGDAIGAVGSFRSAAELSPEWPQPLLALAELLANHPDPAVRRPAEAVSLSTRAVELTGRADPLALTTLATAFASLGDFPQAVTTAEEALAVARQTGQAGLAQALQQRLPRYRRGQR